MSTVRLNALEPTRRSMVLIYHRVANDPLDAQLLCVSPRHFDQQLEVLARFRRVVPLARFLEEWKQKSLSGGSVALTFDDGYLDNLELALPLLEKHRIHATIFVSSQMLGEADGVWGDAVERMFFASERLPVQLPLNDKTTLPTRSPEEIVAAHDTVRRLFRQLPLREIRKELERLRQWSGHSGTGHPERPMLNEDQLRRLAASPCIEIGAHGVTHSRLSILSPQEQMEEIQKSGYHLSQIIGRPVRLFAYPYGSFSDYSKDTAQMVEKAGYGFGISNVQGDIAPDSPPFEIPRRLVRDWNGESFARWLLNPDESKMEERSLAQRQKRLTECAQARRGSVAEGLTAPSCRSSVGAIRKVVHINTSVGDGGAAASTIRTATAQFQSGLDVKVLVGHKGTDNPLAEAFDICPLPEIVEFCRSHGYLDFEFQGSHCLVNHPAIRKADIIHLHNLHGGYFNPLSVALLSRVKPVVWTLRDMQSITGHCAHSLACAKWESGCHECPDLGIYPAVPVDSCHELWVLKRHAYATSRLQIVTPSNWLKQKVERSILSNHPVELIYNGVDTEQFRPIPKEEARRRLNLPLDKIIIGSAADGGIGNPWKGGEYFVAVSQALRIRYSNVEFVSAGTKGSGTAIRRNQYGILELPYVRNEEHMALFYSALDFLLYASIADTCPLVVIESIACGTPVIGFETGGVPEIARHQRDGLIAEYRNPKALFDAAVQFIESCPSLKSEMQRSARDRAVRIFGLKRMHEQYLSLYERVVESWQVLKPSRFSKFEKLPAFVRTREFLNALNAINRADLNAEALRPSLHVSAQVGESVETQERTRRTCPLPQKPLVSAIVSTYNSERFIRGCLEDLEAQTIADQIEIIVVDSCSLQNERAIVEEFQERYGNIVYIRTDTRETVYGAWNRGVKAARGKYVTNANTDDRHRRDAFEVLARQLDQHPKIALAYADVIITDEENKTFETARVIGNYKWLDFSRTDLVAKGCFVGPQPMWRRSLHNEHGYFDPDFISAGDYEFWMRLAKARDFLHVKETLGVYLESASSVEHSNTKAAEETYIAFSRHAADLLIKEGFPEHLVSEVVTKRLAESAVSKEANVPPNGV